MPSGKQILLSVIQELSQKRSADQDAATDRLNSAMLIHASTAYETWFSVEKHAWISEEDSRYDDSVRQGVGLKSGQVFLTDLFEAVMDSEELPSKVKERFPDLERSDFEDSMFIIWQLLTALQYNSYYDSVESGGDLDDAEKERFISSYLQKLNRHREDSDEFHGVESN